MHEPNLDEIRRALALHRPAAGDVDPRAAVAMILRDNGGLETLFIKRAERHGDPWSGQMAFPGGRADANDLTPEHTARRETLEEVGIELGPEMRIGRLQSIEGGRLRAHRLAVAPYVFHHPGAPEAVHDNHEVADTVWIPVPYLLEAGNVQPYVFHLDPEAREFPSFQYNGYTVWGLTYRILSNFASLFGVALPGEPVVTNVE